MPHNPDHPYDVAEHETWAQQATDNGLRELAGLLLVLVGFVLLFIDSLPLILRVAVGITGLAVGAAITVRSWRAS